MKVRSSTRATSEGSDAAQNEFGFLLLVQFDEGAGIDEFLGEALPLLVGAVGPDDLVGRGEGGDLVDPGLKARVGGGGGHDGHG
jgi:hypothetical protein